MSQPKAKAASWPHETGYIAMQAWSTSVSQEIKTKQRKKPT